MEFYDTLGKICCPIHHEPLNTSDFHVNMKIGPFMRVAKCNSCNSLYSNDRRILMFKNAQMQTEHGTVSWSGYTHKRGTIKKIIPTFSNGCVNIVSTTKEIQNESIIKCQILISGQFRIDGIYSKTKNKIYVSISVFEQLSNKSINFSKIEISDPKNLLAQSKNGRKILGAVKKSKSGKHELKIDQQEAFEQAKTDKKKKRPKLKITHTQEYFILFHY